jgi:hypothetical protein
LVARGLVYTADQYANMAPAELLGSGDGHKLPEVAGARGAELVPELIRASVYYNAEIMHDNYPPHIREKALPMSDAAKKQRVVVTIPFITLLLGFPAYSNLKLKRQNHGHLSLKNAFINAYAVFAFSNLFDLLVLDYLVVLRMGPRFAMLPGTKESDYSNDYFFHFVGFLKGMGYGMIPSLIIAYFTSRNWKRH